MKKTIPVIIALMLILCACSNIFETKIPIPKYDSKETHFGEGFQDYTDYSKYFYNKDSEIKFQKSKYFSIVKDNDINKIKRYILDFEDFVKYEKYYDKYDFNFEQIKAGDYFAIRTKEGQPIGNATYGKYDDYDVFYYDKEKCILYVFHNNI